MTQHLGTPSEALVVEELAAALRQAYQFLVPSSVLNIITNVSMDRGHGVSAHQTSLLYPSRQGRNQ